VAEAFEASVAVRAVTASVQASAKLRRIMGDSKRKQSLPDQYRDSRQRIGMKFGMKFGMKSEK
jgi:hypothetical protein